MPLPVRYHFYLTLLSPIVLLPILQLLVQLRNGAAARRDCGFTKCIEERFKGGKTVRVRQYTNKISVAAAKTRSNEIKALPLLAQYPDLRVPNVTVLESTGTALFYASIHLESVEPSGLLCGPEVHPRKITGKVLA